MSIRLDFACNDPANGLFAGRCTAITGQDLLFELEHHDWERGSRFREDDDRIVLAGKPWPVVSSREWFGNWCWNAYWFDEEVGADFMVWLHGRQLFAMTMGEERMFSRWRFAEPFTAHDREFFQRQMLKAALSESATQGNST